MNDKGLRMLSLVWKVVIYGDAKAPLLQIEKSMILCPSLRIEQKKALCDFIKSRLVKTSSVS